MEKEQPKKDFRHLVRLVNTDLDGSKPIVYALKKIKGISFMYSNMVCQLANIDGSLKTGEMSEEQVRRIEEIIKNPSKFNVPIWMMNRKMDPESGVNRHLVGSDLSFAQDMDIKMMKKIKSYKGLRHQWGLPVRGQRTKSNFRRNKGKVTLGVIRKKAQPASEEKAKK
jgi:small subunit ribosomal protein S13